MSGEIPRRAESTTSNPSCDASAEMADSSMVASEQSAWMNSLASSVREEGGERDTRDSCSSVRAAEKTTGSSRRGCATEPMAVKGLVTMGLRCSALSAALRGRADTAGMGNSRATASFPVSDS